MTDIARCPHCGTDFTPLHLLDEIERLRSLADSMGQDNIELIKDKERLQATVNAQSEAIERADRLVIACEQHLRDAKHEITKLRNDLREAGILR